MTSFRQLSQQRHGAWRRQAHNDLAFAKLAKDNGYWAQSCYYASQAAANGLKGALLEIGFEPPHTQLLNDLVQRLGDNGLNIEQLKVLPLRGLSRMAIQSRYPLDATPLSDLFDPADAEQALATAADVLDILEALDQQGGSEKPPNWSDWTA